MKGRVDGREDTPKLMAMEITRPEIHLDSGPPVRIRVKASALTDERVARLKEILAAHPGDSPVFVHLVGPEKETVLQLGDEFYCEQRQRPLRRAPHPLRRRLHPVIRTSDVDASAIRIGRQMSDAVAHVGDDVLGEPPSCVRSVSRSKPSGGTMKRDTPRSA